MRVLDVLREAEDDVLNITKPEDDDVLNITKPEDDDVLKITKPEDDDVLKITKPGAVAPVTGSTNMNWQRKMLSKDSWLLLFFHADYKTTKGGHIPSKNRLESLYSEYVLKPAPDYPINYLTNKLISRAKLPLEGESAEVVVTNLIKRIQKALGITIGPNWKVKDLKGVTVKHVELVKDFIKVVQGEMRDDPKSDDWLAKDTKPVEDKDANKTAWALNKALNNKSYVFFDDPDTDEIYVLIQSIPNGASWDKIEQKYNTTYSKDETLIEALKRFGKKEEAKKVIEKIDTQLRRLGVSLNLQPKSPYNWMGQFKLGDTVEGPEQFDKWMNEVMTKLTQEFPDMMKWAQGAGSRYDDAAKEVWTRQLKALLKKTNKKPTVRQLLETWKKYYFDRLVDLYDKAK